jgi:alpha-1,3-rhamnosyl/mannosyltransferase
MIPLIFPEYFSKVQRIIYRVSHKMALRAASHIIAVSETTKSDLIRCFHVAPDLITVIPHGVDKRFHRRPPSEISTVQRKYSLPDEYVLYLGTNKPHKNLLNLIKAWGILNAKRKTQNTKLVIAGYWDDRYQNIKEFVTKEGLEKNVIFIGEIVEHDLPALYSGARLFVFPSRYEGFGLPILEAMACGTPVACSRASSIPKIAGEAVLFFDPLNTSEISQTIHNIMTDSALWEKLGNEGIQQASLFTWEKTAAQVLAIYNKVLMSV